MYRLGEVSRRRSLHGSPRHSRPGHMRSGVLISRWPSHFGVRIMVKRQPDKTKRYFLKYSDPVVFLFIPVPQISRVLRSPTCYSYRGRRRNSLPEFNEGTYHVPLSGWLHTSSVLFSPSFSLLLLRSERNVGRKLPWLYHSWVWVSLHNQKSTP